MSASSELLSCDPLSPAVRRHFSELQHAGGLDELENGIDRCAAGDRIVHGEAGREATGTRVRFELRLRNGRITAARYRAYGCPHTLAVCEWLAGRLEGQSIFDFYIGLPITWATILDIPVYKLGRLLIVEDALCAALCGVEGQSVVKCDS